MKNKLRPFGIGGSSGDPREKELCKIFNRTTSV